MVRIACTSCKTGYRIPEEKLPKRKVVTTCKKCGTSIIVDPAHLLQTTSATRVARPAEQKASQQPTRQPARQVVKPASPPAEPSGAPKKPAGLQEKPQPAPTRMEKQPFQAATFWRRAAAFAIDFLPLFTIAFLTGFFLFYPSMEAGFAVVFLIALIYFGVFHSAVGRGQTPGMRLLKIKLQDRSGGRIPLSRSFLRFSVLSLPFLLIATMPTPGLLSNLTVYVLSSLAVGAAGALIYLALFNRQTGQSLQDLAAGTYVVFSAHRGPVSFKPIWKGHALALVAWLAASSLTLHWALPVWQEMRMQTPPVHLLAESKLQSGPSPTAHRQGRAATAPGNTAVHQEPVMDIDPAVKKLFIAIARGDADKVNRMLEEESVDVNASAGGGQTALMRILMLSPLNMELLSSLLNHGADANLQDERGNTALMIATMRQDLGVVRMLITYGADIGVKDAKGCTVLHYACTRGEYKLVDLLLDKGAAIDARDNNGLSPLQYAVNAKSSFLVSRLIQRGADVHSADGGGQSIMAWALSNQSLGLVKDLMQKGVPLPVEGPLAGSVLTLAALNGDRALLKTAISQGIDVNAPNEHGSTALNNAVGRGDLPIVAFLLEHGADVNAPDYEDTTALWLACRKCKTKDIVRLLLEKGADVNQPSTVGATPLAKAAEANCTVIVKMLIERGADINFRDDNGMTAIMRAARGGHREMVSLLLASGAEIGNKNAIGDTALTLTQSPEIRNLLVKAGATEELAVAEPHQFEIIHALPYDKRLAKGLQLAVEHYDQMVSSSHQQPLQATLAAKQLNAGQYEITYFIKPGGKPESFSFILTNSSAEVQKNLATLEKKLAEFAARREGKARAKPVARATLQEVNGTISDNISHFDYLELFQTLDLIDQKIASGEMGLAGLYRVAEIYSWLSFFKNCNQSRDLSDLLGAHAVGNYLLAGLAQHDAYDRDFYKGLLLLALDYPAAAESVLRSGHPHAAALAAFIRADTSTLKSTSRHLTANRRLCGYLLARAYESTGQGNLANQQYHNLMTDFPDFLLAKEFATENGRVGISRQLMQSYIVELVEKHLHLINRYYRTDWIADDHRLLKEIRKEVPANERLEKWLAVHSEFVKRPNRMKKRTRIVTASFLDEFMMLDIWNALRVNYRLEAERLGRLPQASSMVELVETIYPDSTLALNFAIRNNREHAMRQQLLKSVDVETADRPLLEEIFNGQWWDRKKDLYILKTYRSSQNPDARGSLKLHEHYNKLLHRKVARKCIENALAANPYDTGSYKKLLTRGDGKKYVEMGRKRIGNQYEYLVAVADWYVEKKENKEAEKLLKRAIKLYPAQQTAYEKLGNLYKQEKKHDQAVETWQLYFAYDSSSLSAVALKRKIGHLYIENGDYEKAYEIFLDAQKSYQADALLGFARASELTGRTLQAEDVYRKATERYPQGSCPANLGLFYLRQNNKELAYKIFREYKRYQPFYYYYEQLIDHYIESGSPEKAVDVIKQIETDNGESWSRCLNALYQIYARKGQYLIAARLAQERGAKHGSLNARAQHYEFLLKAKQIDADQLVSQVMRRHKANVADHIARHLLEKEYYNEAAGIFVSILDKDQDPMLTQRKWTLAEGLVDAAVAWCLSSRDASVSKKIRKKLATVSDDSWTTARVQYLLGNAAEDALQRQANGKEKQYEYYYYKGVVEASNGRKETALNSLLMCLDMEKVAYRKGYQHAYQLAKSLES